MGKPRDRAAAALRNKAEAAFKLDRDGRHEEAIARADDLAARHEGSALVLHLAGLVHDAAARRAAIAGDVDASAQHIRNARDYLTRAKQLVPNCISISVHLARVLFMAMRHDEAEKEAREAINIASPVDPAANNVMYAFVGLNSTRDQRVLSCRKSALDVINDIERWRFLRLVREVLELDTGSHDGARDALKRAKELVKRYPSSGRAQVLSAHMQLQCVRVLGPDVDRRPFLDRIRAAIKEAIASSFDSSLVFAMLHAKLCFVLGLYDAVHFECVRALFDIPVPVDPKLEDVPPGSFQGDTLDHRVRSVHEELGRLLNKLFLVADDFRSSMTSEKQDGFLSVRLVELQEYYAEKYENYQWAAQTISDALTFVNENKSWRFWICPFCAAGNKLPNTDSLLEHMNSKHLRNLRSVFDSKLSQFLILDDELDGITVYQDSEGHHFFRYYNTDYVFGRLSVPTEGMSIAGIQEKICERGKEILEEIKDKLKRLPADKLSAEFDKARPEIEDLWVEFVQSSFLDYRTVIKTFAKPFIWNKLLQSLSEDKAASKISSADIDVVFPNIDDVSEVHAEDRAGRSEIHPNSNIADVQGGTTGLKYLPSIANENSASNLLGSSSQYSEETTSISIYPKSIEVLDKDANDILILNFIIQILWNWRCFRDEFFKRRPVCTLPSHDGPCFSQMLYHIFSGWEKNYHHRTSCSLISLRETILQVLNDSTVFENINVSTSSYIVTTILNGLGMPEVFQEASIVNFPVDRKMVLKQPANPANVLCKKEIICEGFDTKESTTCGDKLDACSLQITEVKSFADNKCRQVDQLSVRTPEFSTLAVHILPTERENLRTLREELNAMISYPDLVLFSFADPIKCTIKCTLVSMIFCHDGKLLSIARDKNKWLVLVYNDAVITELTSWEDLLHDYGDLEIQPGVCFFENIKIII